MPPDAPSATPTADNPTSSPQARFDAHDPALLVSVELLQPYIDNARRGDVPSIAESLDELAQYKPITVNRGTLTGRPDEVLAGNNTLAAAIRLGWEAIAAVWVDVDDTAARKINLTDNRTSDRATYDPQRLAASVASLQGNYRGTGWSVHDLDGLAKAVRDVTPTTPRLPTGPQPPLRSDRTKVITCPSCAHEFDATSAVEVRRPNQAGGRS